MSKRVSYGQTMTLDAAHFTFERVAAGLAAGHLQLSRDQHEVTLEPRAVVHLSLEAKSGTREQHLTIKLRWLRNSLESGSSTANGTARANGAAVETYDQLYQRARRLGLEGRSRMSKSELATALLAAEHD